MTRLQTRTDQELLAERRRNLQEWWREKDEMAKAMLLAHIDEIDVELKRRREAALAHKGIR